MFFFLEKDRVFFEEQADKKSFLEQKTLKQLIEEAKENNYIYVAQNGRVYDIQGYYLGTENKILV